MKDEANCCHLSDENNDSKSPTKVIITERTSSVSDYINTFEVKPKFKTYDSEFSFDRRSSLVNAENDNIKWDTSIPISRHSSMVPSSDSLYQNKLSDSNHKELKVNCLRKTVAINNLNNSASLEVAGVAEMDQVNLYAINDIDINQIPGYSKIPDNIPKWKRYQLETKNKDAISDYLEAKQREEIEKRKYGDIPQWKKDLLIKKEKQLIEQNNPADPDDKRFGNIPQWKKELLKKKCPANDK